MRALALALAVLYCGLMSNVALAQGAGGSDAEGRAGASSSERGPGRSPGSIPIRSPGEGTPSAAAARTDEPGEPPLALTDPGGQGLDLEQLEVRVAAHGPLALTELEMVFRNPLGRRIEGKLVCALPAGATVSRFAKEVGGKLVEGEVVERLRATQVYTEILHTMQDPALLEQDQGNRFKARIFPIDAKAAVRLIISYSTVNPVDPSGTRRITVPLRGMSRIGRLKLLAICRPLPGEAVQLADASGAVRPLLSKDRITFAEELDRKDFQPTEDLVLAFRAGADAPPAARLVAGDFQVAMFRPPAPAAAEVPKAARIAVLVDTSASQAGSGAARLAALARVLEHLGAAYPGAPIAVEAFDIAIAPVLAYRGGEPQAGAVAKALEERHFLGATDLARAVTRAGEWARAEASPGLVVLVTDGIASFGTKETGDIVRALGAWPAACSLHVLSIGSILDATVAQEIAEAGGGRVVTLPLTTAWEAGAKQAVEELARPRGADYQAYDEAAEWIEPKRFPDAQAGAELVAFSRRKRGATAEVGVTSGKGAEVRASAPPVVAPEWAPLLEREAYRAQLALLERQENETRDASRRAELRKQRVELSVNHRVVCPLTSLLVLESEHDFARFGIDRRALADIMVVGKTGIELVKRQVAPLPPRLEPVAENPPRAPEDHEERGPRVMQESAPVQPDDPLSTLSAPAAAMDEGESPEAESAPGAAPAAPPPPPRPAPAPAEAAFPGPSASTGLTRYRGTQTSRAAGTGTVAAGGGVDARDAFVAPELAERSGEPARRSAGSAPLMRIAAPRAQRSAATSAFWTHDAGARPSPVDLDRLRKRVADKPLDRGERNQLAFALNRARDNRELLAQAFAWQAFDPENPMVYEYAGNAFARLRAPAGALRAYSSIAEVSPGDSGLLNRAGFLLLKAGEAGMSATLFRFAIERRPDHANNYRGLALALWTADRHEDAVKALSDALAREYHGRYGDLPRVLREEVSYVLAAWIAADPAAKPKAQEYADRLKANLSHEDALRITLHWETDANDVDLHVVDPEDMECYYEQKQVRSGLQLYEDLTQGLGPECAVVPPGSLLKGVYHVGVKYFAAGPMGVSRGVVLVQRPGKQGKPDLQIETFCLLSDLDSGQDMRHVAVVESASP